jgi:nucleotide-binding universal stress UspA family protein
VIEEKTMHTIILIPTDGSELAGKAVQHGIALAKRIGAKVTVLRGAFDHTFTTIEDAAELALPLLLSGPMRPPGDPSLSATADT